MFVIPSLLMMILFFATAVALGAATFALANHCVETREWCEEEDDEKHVSERERALDERERALRRAAGQKTLREAWTEHVDARTRDGAEPAELEALRRLEELVQLELARE